MADGRIGSHFVQDEEPDQINGDVGGGIPFRITVSTESLKPMFNALFANGVLLLSGTTAHLETLLGKQVSGQILGDMEQ
ncbi:hypothetical protein D3C76_1553290 [compost metagenome]